MWTTENRHRYDRDKLRYPSDLTDAEWQLIKPLIPAAKRGGGKRTVVMREVVNGLMYVLSTGCQWRYIPKDLPPRSTGAMQGYQLSETLEGEIAATLDSDIQYQPAFGMARLFPTQATATEVVETIRKARAGAQDNAFKARTVIVQLPGGRVGSFAAYESAERRTQHSAAIRRARENPEFRRVLPNDPVEIPVRIITSTG